MSSASEPHDLFADSHSFDWAERLQTYYIQAKLHLRRHWWVMLTAVCLGMAVQAYRELRRSPSYQSQGRMMVSGRIALPEGAVYREELSNFFGTQLSLMQSGRVKERARQRVLQLHPELAGQGARLSALQQPDASIFILRAEGGEPRYTQAFLDAVMEEYIIFRREMRSQTSENTLLAITDQLLRLENDISRQEAEVVEFQKSNNLVFIKEQGNSSGAYLSQLKNSQASLKTQLLFLEKADSGAVPETALAAPSTASAAMRAEVGADAALRETRLKLSALQAEMEQFGRYLKPRHPKMIGLRQEIERTGTLLEAQQRQVLAELTERKETLRSQIEALDTVIGVWEGTALDNGRRAAEFERLTARLDRSRSTYQRLLDSIQSIDLNQKLDQETVAIMETASPATMAGVDVTGKVIQGALAGLLAGACVLLAISAIDSRIVSAEDLKNRFDLPVLGILPRERMNEKGLVPFLKANDGRHLFAEACRTVRSSLLFMQGSEARPKTILITSSVPEEGKSTIAVNLAIALAFTSAPTLLVDADLRRGQLGRPFGFSNKPGFSDMLRGEGIDSIRPSGVDHLDLLTSGQYPERPGELLLSPRMDEMIETFRQRYQYVIFDSAPILATDDTLGFSVKMDSVLLITRSVFTHSRQVKTSLERLRMRGAPVQGFILNCADVRGADYYYYNKKYKGYYDQASATH